jgi:hypothetical protein
MAEPHPYARRRFIYACARIEFDAFRRIARKVYEAELARIPRGHPLRDIHAFIVKSFDEFTVQIWFGKHPTGRTTLNKEGASTPVTEVGGTLLYSLGPRGDVAVVLLPAKSEVMEAKEEFIVRRVANLTCYELSKGIHANLNDLIAYTYATTLDGCPTICERLRVRWLRLVCPMQIKGEQNRRATQLLYQGVGFIARSGVIALLRPFGLLLLIIVLALFGFSSIANLLTKFVH